jgi:adenylate cyclase class 2
MMPLEIEVKLRVESHEVVRRELRSLGAESLGCVLESNSILDRPDGSLRRRGCGLRIRESRSEEDGGTTATLTMKGPVHEGAVKTREELEVRVDDADRTAQLFGALGFAPVLRYQKRRESWRLGLCRIELDEPPHIGLFVEIEGPSEQAIRAVQTDLGLGDLRHESASYIHMLTAYCREHGIADEIVSLP